MAAEKGLYFREFHEVIGLRENILANIATSELYQ